jgi:hypothetical protein
VPPGGVVRLLDLFCGAGGAGEGYRRAGFDVVGVDLEPHPYPCGQFVEADAMDVLEDVAFLRSFDAVHASPPCKAFTRTGWAYRFGYHADHPDLLTPTRERLEVAGVPWIVENVPGAPLRPDALLCGCQFGLGVRRQRWFELSWPYFELMPPHDHSRTAVSPHGRPNRHKGSAAQWRVAMGIDWMGAEDLAQAIPPAYTEHLGRRLFSYLTAPLART